MTIDYTYIVNQTRWFPNASANSAMFQALTRNFVRSIHNGWNDFEFDAQRNGSFARLLAPLQTLLTNLFVPPHCTLYLDALLSSFFHLLAHLVAPELMRTRFMSIKWTRRFHIISTHCAIMSENPKMRPRKAFRWFLRDPRQPWLSLRRNPFLRPFLTISTYSRTFDTSSRPACSSSSLA